MAKKNIAIMQPYVFPYLPYFQLINASDKFVFLDDVNFIKNGWINRNKIIINKSENFFTIPLDNISSFKKINNTSLCERGYPIWKRKMLKTLVQSYSKAPFFDDVMPFIEDVLEKNYDSISEMAQFSIKNVLNYLNINPLISISSIDHYDSIEKKKAERLFAIIKNETGDGYINSIGGQKLYSKKEFLNQGIELKFLQSKEVKYNQFSDKFIPNLSIIDILMFNSIGEINSMLNEFKLI